LGERDWVASWDLSARLGVGPAGRATGPGCRPWPESTKLWPGTQPAHGSPVDAHGARRAGAPSSSCRALLVWSGSLFHAAAHQDRRGGCLKPVPYMPARCGLVLPLGSVANEFFFFFEPVANEFQCMHLQINLAVFSHPSLQFFFFAFCI
jgi:hypothetical protein